jgi:hypothetical protein
VFPQFPFAFGDLLFSQGEIHLVETVQQDVDNLKPFGPRQPQEFIQQRLVHVANLSRLPRRRKFTRQRIGPLRDVAGAKADDRIAGPGDPAHGAA